MPSGAARTGRPFGRDPRRYLSRDLQIVEPEIGLSRSTVGVEYDQIHVGFAVADVGPNCERNSGICRETSSAGWSMVSFCQVPVWAYELPRMSIVSGLPVRGSLARGKTTRAANCRPARFDLTHRLMSVLRSRARRNVVHQMHVGARAGVELHELAGLPRHVPVQTCGRAAIKLEAAIVVRQSPAFLR